MVSGIEAPALDSTPAAVKPAPATAAAASVASSFFMARTVLLLVNRSVWGHARFGRRMTSPVGRAVGVSATQARHTGGRQPPTARRAETLRS
ncbi:hypothetical protein GCM10009716_11570 [Streptomyces sodiiphilus]|uniref:Uncharacterized protein n=1 Tax=Streptomyces sodiiphilus TaxID=226217 RepID=A0ABN2NUB9_9ACTN